MQNVFSIAIDGPSGAGKSSVARAVAEKLGAMYLDTGAMYRAVGLYMLKAGVPLDDPDALAENCRRAEVRARRRYDELSRKGMREPYEKVLEELIRRDEVDTHREASPLRKAEDAVEVDCSQMTLEEVVETVVSLARQAVEGKA